MVAYKSLVPTSLRDFVEAPEISLMSLEQCLHSCFNLTSNTVGRCPNVFLSFFPLFFSVLYMKPMWLRTVLMRGRLNEACGSIMCRLCMIGCCRVENGLQSYFEGRGHWDPSFGIHETPFPNGFVYKTRADLGVDSRDLQLV